MNGTPPVAVCIAGPTASGKTDLALKLATHLPVEIISVDSAMVYRYMDIGTAKPSAVIRAQVPHHLIDIREPWQRYSAGMFRSDALALIPRIVAAGRLPVLVGGTGLYFRVLQRGLARLPEADPAVRAQLDAEARERGWPALHRELADVDPDAAARIQPADAQRIQRALEVYRLTGMPISRLQRGENSPPGIRFVSFALLPGDRQALHARIEQRLHAMLDAGFVDEVSALLARPEMQADMPSLRAVGYRQIVQYLRGECDLDEAVRRAVVATRRYAKRQFTWLKSEPDFQPIDSTSPDALGTVLAAVRNCAGFGALSNASR
ncbi:MAG TPA: tRNA (adenosine(37)-N6)-dimethylallyltransferase MiaA [Chromatiales bacterium]|nr:tRNA (adenosine(37)-N6)-dimethylallyltransferase MiaA [Chromatiales bacterium]